MIIYHDYVKVNWQTLLLIPGLFVIYFNAMTFGTILSIIGTRFRDISQIIKSLVQVVLFVTPIMWNPEILNESKRYIAELNPVYSFIQLIRAPLLGKTPTLLNISMVTAVSLLGLFISMKLFIRYRARIIYWL